MVGPFSSLPGSVHWFGTLVAATAQASEPLLLRLDPERRAKVLMSLVGLVLLGAALILLAYLGGRRLRRIARRRPALTSRGHDDWYRKPLIPREPAAPPPHEPE
jgi:hypothetical protein